MQVSHIFRTPLLSLLPPGALVRSVYLIAVAIAMVGWIWLLGLIGVDLVGL